MLIGDQASSSAKTDVASDTKGSDGKAGEKKEVKVYIDQVVKEELAAERKKDVKDRKVINGLNVSD